MVHNKQPGQNPGSLVMGRPALPLFAVIGTALLIGLVLALSCGGGSDNNQASGTPTDSPHAGLAAGEVPTPEATIDIARPTVVPAVNPNLTQVGANDRIIISKFGIDAPLTLKTVGADGQMPDPDGSDDVALYDFSAWPGLGGGPGTGGNAVFAGHVDSGRKACKNGTVQPPCQAVFWDVNKLRVGDEIEVRIGDQTIKYSVQGNQSVPASSPLWEQIVATTEEETITLITCGGDFSNGEYSNRQVVTAVRMPA